MATEKQFAFFQYLFEQENARGDKLNEYGKNAIALVTGYSGFVLWVAENMKAHLTDYWVRFLFLDVIGFMLIALVAALWATRLAEYQVLNDPEAVVRQFGPAAMADEAFYDNRIADATVATQWNSGVNDRKARWLVVAAALLVSGIFFHAVFFVKALF